MQVLAQLRVRHLPVLVLVRLVKHARCELTTARVVLVLQYERHELTARKDSRASRSDRGEDLLPFEVRSQYAHLDVAVSLEELAQLAESGGSGGTGTGDTG